MNNATAALELKGNPMSHYNEIADQLWQATVSGQTTESIALANPDLGLDGAYTVQALMVAKREAAGAVRTGRKLGVTAAGGMKMFGISEPVHGVLFGTGALPNGGAVAIGGQTLQPKLETEMGFIMGQDIDTIPASPDALAEAVEAAVPCYEIAGSRIDGWPKGIEDLVADSCGFCAYVIGEGRAKPSALDLASIQISIAKNGEHHGDGTGAECMGNPLNALMWLVEKLVDKGEGLKAGDLVLTGALGGMIPVEAGQSWTSTFDGLGSVSVSFV